MTSINYVELVTSAKTAARDVLRTEKVQALLGYISSVEANISNVKEGIEYATKQLARYEYDFRIAEHFESPDLEEQTKTINEQRESHVKFVEEAQKQIAEYETKVAGYNTKIENWHNGTSKVDAERMNDLAIKFVKDKVGSDFNAGLYAAASEQTS